MENTDEKLNVEDEKSEEPKESKKGKHIQDYESEFIAVLADTCYKAMISEEDPEFRIRKCFGIMTALISMACKVQAMVETMSDTPQELIDNVVERTRKESLQRYRIDRRIFLEMMRKNGGCSDPGCTVCREVRSSMEKEIDKEFSQSQEQDEDAKYLAELIKKILKLK